MNYSRNQLFVMSPFRTHFSLQEGNVLAAGKDYARFWKKAENSNFGTGVSERNYTLKYFHNYDTEELMQFESVSEDSNVLGVFSPKVIEIKPEKWVSEIIKEKINTRSQKYGTGTDGFCYVEGTCRLTIFKNTVAALELLLNTNLKDSELDESCIDRAEKFTNKILEDLISFFYEDIIHPLIMKINKTDEKTHFISPLYKHYGFPDIAESSEKALLFKRRSSVAVPLWVSRILLTGKPDGEFDDLLKRWVITTRSKERIVQQMRKIDSDEKNSVYMGWMHSLVTCDFETHVFEDARQAMSLIQYYYAVLDSVNMNLSQIIGISHKEKSVKETIEYKKFLEEMVFIADLNKVEFTDVMQSMQRNRAFFFKDLVQKWTVNDLFDNVDKKITLCKDNIDKIYQKAFNRSQKVAELLLFFISGFAILEFLKGLSEFFWSSENFDNEVWGLYDLGRVLGPNTMLWLGIVIFSILFIVYIRIIDRR